MPELPEVETVRRQLDRRLRGAMITGLQIWKSGREYPNGMEFFDGVVGRRIQSIDRRAKLLIWRFEDGGAMIGHLKMTGRFLFVEKDYLQQKHDRILFLYTDTKGKIIPLVWADVRQFGFLRLVSVEGLERILSEYGPEPLLVTPEVLAERFMHPKTRTIKAALLNQSVIAGVGNIYADEACHRAGIHPKRRLHTLTQNDRMRLAQAIQDVLNESLAQHGTSANDYVDTSGGTGGFLSLLRVYGRQGEECHVCHKPIQRIVLHQRGTHFCPTCQR